MKLVLGISGSIAAYKSCDLVRRFVERGDEVQVVLTRSAAEFVTPLTLAVLSRRSVHEKLFGADAAVEILEAATALIEGRHDLEGIRVLVTAGATREAIDPIRFVSNRSSGKMGIELAEKARARGARITLLLGAGPAVPERAGMS